jgi:hypothetical protein
MVFLKKTKILIEILTDTDELDLLGWSFKSDFHGLKKMEKFQGHAIVNSLEVLIKGPSTEGKTQEEEEFKDQSEAPHV